MIQKTKIKYLAIIFLYFLQPSLIYCQSNFYIGLTTGLGFPIMHSEFRHNKAQATTTDKGKWTPSKKGRNPISFGYKLTGGLIVKNQLLVGTGIKFMRKIENGVSYTDSGDHQSSSEAKLNLSGIEIPLIVNLFLLKDRKYQPVLTFESYWLKSINLLRKRYYLFENFNSFGYKLGVGISKRTKSNIVTIETKLNRDFGIRSKNNKGRYRYGEVMFSVKFLSFLS